MGNPGPDSTEAFLDDCLNAQTHLSVKSYGFGLFRPWWRAEPKSDPSRHLDHTLVLVTEGATAYAPAPHKAMRLESGTLFWLSPGEPHNFWLPGGAPEETPYYIRFSLVHHSRVVRLARKWLHLESAWEFRTLFDALLQELKNQAAFAQARIRGLLVALLAGALRREVLPPTAGPVLSNDQKERLFKYMCEHGAGRPTPANFARELRLSPDYFTRLFRNTFEMPPRKWIMDQRIRMAAGLMAGSTLNVTEVALKYGYSDVFLFSRQFKQVMGCGPLAYRRSQGRSAQIDR